MTEYARTQCLNDQGEVLYKFHITNYEIENPLHYSKHAIEPKEYIMANGLGWCEGNVVKYITRWRDKGGIDDLRKAREFINMLIDNNTHILSEKDRKETDGSGVEK